MTKKESTCFEPNHLSRFLREELDETEESSTIEHLDQCPECQNSLEQVAAGASLWTDLQNHFGDSTQPGFHASASSSAPGPSQVLRSVQDFLGPTDDPAMMGRIGPYEIVGIVGRGSTGIVLKAFEPRLNRFVAIKVLAPNFASSGSARVRFQREARAVAAVAHEHVIPIFAVDEFRDLPYLVMQYAGGGSLQQRIEQQGPLAACEIARVGMQVASGLAAAHTQGIVHRDVKPANVMLEGGVDRALVTDFGLARVADEASMTRSGAITGTPQFMSPEQAKGEYIDHRSDLFSLGSLMYTASTGRPPFRAETIYGVIRRVCESEIRPVREINPSIPVWLEAFIAKLCSKDRELRFQSADEVRALLTRELAHLQTPQNTDVPSRSWLPTEPAPQAQTATQQQYKPSPVWWMASLAIVFLVMLPLAWDRIRDAFADNFVVASTNIGEAQFQTDALAVPVWNPSQLPVFESTITRALPAPTHGRLQLVAGDASVQILPSRSGQLEVRAVRSVVAANRQDAETIHATHRLRFIPDDQGLIVRSEFEEAPSERIRITLRIYLPDQFRVDLSMLPDDASTSFEGGELIPVANGYAFRYAKLSESKSPSPFSNINE